jgi:hypothetical protein
MKKPLILISLLILAAGLTWAGLFYWENLRGAAPAIKPSPQNIAKQLKPPAGPPQREWHEIDSAPLKLPPGFAISIYTRDLPGARVLCLDPEGTLLVSLTRQGKVMALPETTG